jgi:hypothetical protein
MRETNGKLTDPASATGKTRRFDRHEATRKQHETAPKERRKDSRMKADSRRNREQEAG